jgi:hypothetical protein
LFGSRQRGPEHAVVYTSLRFLAGLREAQKAFWRSMLIGSEKAFMAYA